MKRREFCGSVCQAVSLVTLGSLAQDCGGSPTAPSVRSVPGLASLTATIVNGVVTLAIDPGSPLQVVGAAALVNSDAGTFLVRRSAQNTFTAMTGICTHEACTITGFDGSRFVCPCHGSEFNTSGGVAVGPASSPLRQFTAQFANSVLTIA